MRGTPDAVLEVLEVHEVNEITGCKQHGDRAVRDPYPDPEHYGMYFNMEQLDSVAASYFVSYSRKRDARRRESYMREYLADVRKMKERGEEEEKRRSSFAWLDLGSNVNAHEARTLDFSLRGTYNAAACKIQRRFREAIVDPRHRLCSQRLLREFSELANDAA